MALNVIGLKEILEIRGEEDTKRLLLTFETLNILNTITEHDVQTFLHSKAIEFEKMDISRTYLVFSTYQGKPYLAGYFSLSARPLIISKRLFQSLSNSMKKKLLGFGYKTEQQAYEVKSFLLGQLGKNYSNIARKANLVTGDDLLNLSYEKVKEAQKIVGGRILYLECDNFPRLVEFYQRNKFVEIGTLNSESKQLIMIKRIDSLWFHLPHWELFCFHPITKTFIN